MATKTDSTRKLTEAELNAPDLEEGTRDVELYPIPDGNGIEDSYLKKVWDKALSLISEKGQSHGNR